MPFLGAVKQNHPLMVETHRGGPQIGNRLAIKPALVIDDHDEAIESPLALAFAVGIAFVVSGIVGIVWLSILPVAESTRQTMPFVAIGWPELTLAVAAFAVFASTLNLTGNICMSRAYQTADSSWLAPLDFSYLAFAAIWSRLIFDAWPTTQATTGMALIAAAGVITAWRERIVAEK